MQTGVIKCLMLCICFPVSLQAAFTDMEAGVRPLGMGGAFCAVADDANTIYWNPAGLGRLRQVELVASYFRPFNIKELQFQVISAIIKVPYGSIGGGFINFGKLNYYQEQTMVVSYGTRIWRTLYAGGSLQYKAVKIMPLYGSDWCWGLDSGLLYEVNSKIRIGCSLKNINQVSISTDHEPVPSIINFGLAFIPIKDMVVGLDLYQETRHQLQLKIGQEIGLFRCLFIRTGAQTQPARFSVGGGVYIKYISMDYVYYSHPVLGGSHQISITLKRSP